MSIGNETCAQFERRLRTMGVPDLVVLYDCGAVRGRKEATLYDELRHRHSVTRAMGNTTLPFPLWIEVFRAETTMVNR